jgi:hypothetical protein
MVTFKKLNKPHDNVRVLSNKEKIEPIASIENNNKGIKLHISDNYEFEGCACFCITLKDVDPIHQALLANLLLLKTWMQKSFFVFVNCNSVDSTYENYKSYPNSIILNSLQDDMYKNRNMYLSFVCENKSIFDYMIVIDPHFSLWKPLSLSSFNFLKLKDTQWNAIFANQSYKYYDIENLITKDINILEVPEDEKKQFIKQKQFHIPSNSEYISVDSAYGGFAVYKTYILHETIKYEENNHISFNLKLFGSNSNMFIDPSFVIDTNPANAHIYL